MAFTNFETKEINCKIIYFGPRGSGKTETLRSIYQSTSAEVKAGLMELERSGGSAHDFDFLPISIGHVKDFHLKLHLFTLPVNTTYESVPSVILKGVDGYIFVADSRIEAMADNLEALSSVRRLLSAEGHNTAEMPLVFQYNKRDLGDVVPVDVMRQELNPTGIPDQESIATQSVGTMEALQSMAKLVIRKIAP